MSCETALKTLRDWSDLHILTAMRDPILREALCSLAPGIDLTRVAGFTVREYVSGYFAVGGLVVERGK